ncbi:MAG: FHA domain-containing protein [Myxococcales bacterium]|nr:FHA domain-containing protein [Myxococcales bacterium]
MSQNDQPPDEIPDRKRTMLGRAVVMPPPGGRPVPPKPAARPAAPTWEDDDDAGNKTAALDLSQLSALSGIGKGKSDLTLDEDDDGGEKTLAGIPVFDESGMPAVRPPPRQNTLEQVQSPLATAKPLDVKVPAAPPAASKKPAAERSSLDTEGKTLAQPSPFAEQESEAKTSISDSPFAEVPERKPAMPSAEDKTALAASPFDEGPKSGASKPAPSFRKGNADDEKTRVAPALSEDRTRVGASLREMPQSESTMMFDASALLAPRKEGPVGVVTIEAGPDSGKEFFLRSESTTVGRGLDCDLVLNDASVSRRHFRIDRREDDYVVVDLGSGNGTKVDGAKVVEKKLMDGMRISVGTTTMAFGFVGSELRAPVEEQVVVKKAGWGLRATFILLFLALVGAGTFYTGEKLGWWRVVTPAVSAEELAKPEGPKPWEEPADLTRQKLVEKDLVGARATLAAVTEAGGSPDLVKTLTTRIVTAEKQKALVEAQKKLIDAGTYSEAIRTLKTIPTTSPYFTDANKLIDAAQIKLVEGWKDDAEKLAEKGDYAGAKERLQLVLKELPDDVEATTRITELDEEQKEAEAAKIAADAAAKLAAEAAAKAAALALAPVAPAGDPAAPAGDPAAPAADPAAPAADPAAPAADPAAPAADPAAPAVAVAPAAPAVDPAAPAAPAADPAAVAPKPEFERANFRQGYKLYGQRSFTGAIEFFEDISANEKIRKQDRKRGAAMAEAVRKFSDVYTRAETAVRTRDGGATALLEQAKGLDSQVNGTFQGDIKRSLGEVYAAKASAAFQSNNLKEAVSFANKAKTYNPGDSSASFILERIQGKVDSLLAAGRASKGNSAEKALKAIIGLLPPDDARYQEARKLLNDIEAAKAAQDDD